jgi:mannosyltransferase OCH1-like enzyme
MKSKLACRIYRRLKSTISSFGADCHFSVELAFLRLGEELGGRLGMRALASRAKEKKDAWLQCYLRGCLADVLAQFERESALGEMTANAPVWVCWWTGEETAPPLVRQCIRSIRKNAGDHPVHMITEKTYQEYVKVPAYIMEKVRNKQMGLAHLADYIRANLLAENGGLWLDATIFCSGEIPSLCFDLPVFTC